MDSIGAFQQILAVGFLQSSINEERGIFNIMTVMIETRAGAHLRKLTLFTNTLLLQLTNSNIQRFVH